MPFIVPNSEVILYSNVKITDGEQIAFPSVGSQTSYFTRHIVTRVQNCSYIRKTGYVRLEVPTSTVSGCNYLSFKNASFENKTIYARILNWEYVNNVTTDVLYAIDWFQTFCFDVEYENAYIMREHLSNEDWAKANANPYDPSIYEFQTAENLPVGHMLEDLPAIGTTAQIVARPNTDHRISILIYLAEFDTDEVDWFDSFKQFIVFGNDGTEYLRPEPSPHLAYGYYILPNGDTENITISSDSKIPRAYGVYVIKEMDDKEGQRKVFAKILDMLAVNDLTHQIIGVYAMPEALAEYTFRYNGINVSKAVTPLGYQNIVNKKLYTSPFQYVKVFNNEGDVKEYRYEDFASIRDAANGLTASGYFDSLALYDGVPVITLVPRQYGITTSESGHRAQLNLNERIDINNILQIGYSTDAFLSYLSSQYAKTVGTRTTNDEDYDAKRTISNWVNTGVKAVGSVLSAPDKGIGSMISGLTSAWSDYNATEHAIQKEYKEPSLIEQARSTGASNSEIDSVFGPAKRVHIANEYHAGSSNGALPFYAGFNMEPNWFLLVQVKLKDSVLQEYDNFFSLYGYTANRIGIPKICHFIKQDATTNDEPHFDTKVVSTGTTYCCTKNMHVISPLAVVSTYIENLFNNGCRFHNGNNPNL